MDADLEQVLGYLRSIKDRDFTGQLFGREARALLDEIERLQREADRRDVLIATKARLLSRGQTAAYFGCSSEDITSMVVSAALHGERIFYDWQGERQRAISEQARKEAQGGE